MDVAGPPPAHSSAIATVAALDVIQFDCIRTNQATITDPESLASPHMITYSCTIVVRGRSRTTNAYCGKGATSAIAIADALKLLCRQPFCIASFDHFERDDGLVRCLVTVEKDPAGSGQLGVGRSVEATEEFGLCVAMLRAASHAGILVSDFSANNQRNLRNGARELTKELNDILGLGSIGELKRSEAESSILEHFNRIASAAIVTATNSPCEDAALQLFDTSAWLYDASGKRRDSFTETDSWLAWYPGLDNDTATIGDVLKTLPKTPEAAIPWSVQLFENPESWFRFRGAIHLADHDVLHILLGRGLQDQDEAFVLGFAMGTAKKVSWFQYHVFKFAIVRLYPEPYRIPSFLLPAFDIGLKCGVETGRKDLYREPLKELRDLSVKEARERCGINPAILRQAFLSEKEKIPFTIASLRLST